MRHLSHLVGAQRSERPFLVPGGVLFTPAQNGFTISGLDDATVPTDIFGDGAPVDRRASLLIKGSNPGPHANERFLVAIQYRPVGSGLNGPAQADYGLTISNLKVGYLTGTAAAVGEIDGLSITVRQGGTLSDAGCILAGVQQWGTGFIALFEGGAELYVASVLTKQVRLIWGSIDTPTNAADGYFAYAQVGNLNNAFFADSAGGQTWQNLFKGAKGGTTVFTISGDGFVNSIVSNNSTTTSSYIAEQSSTGDCTIAWTLTAVRAWVAGIDNSDGDKWKLAAQGDGFLTPALAIDVTNNAVFFGTLAATSYKLLTTHTVLNYDGTYTVITEVGSDNPCFSLGNNTDATIYADRTTHKWRATDHATLFATLDVTGFLCENNIKSKHATAGIGYATGAGGTVTQATNKTTGVTLNKATGQITMNAAALAGDTTVSFTLTNSAIAATDILAVWHVSGGTVGSYTITATPAGGTAAIVVRNITTGSLSEAIVIAFAVVKAVTT